MTVITIENGESGFVVRCYNKEYYITSPDKMVHKVRELFGVTRDHGLKGSDLKGPGKPDTYFPSIDEDLQYIMSADKSEPIVEQVDEMLCIPELPEVVEQAEEDTPSKSAVPSTDYVLPSKLPSVELKSFEPFRFKEGDRVSKDKLAPYVGIPRSNMGYHDQGDGVVVLCNNSTKVYTTWEDLFKLPVSTHVSAIMELNYPKRGAIIAFRKWMSQFPELLPAGVDPDADFRPHLSTQDTRIAQDGSKLEGTLDGD
uniref:Uncharacterized protein n=1 Tax=viral metagenome TaxID=1070528 RepID=A0A6M3MFP6_9ZZZZ